MGDVQQLATFMAQIADLRRQAGDVGDDGGTCMYFWIFWWFGRTNLT
jgi:hypothetical protein